MSEVGETLAAYADSTRVAIIVGGEIVYIGMNVGQLTVLLARSDFLDKEPYRLKDALKAERARCAKIAYNIPSYVARLPGTNFMDTDENGMIPPGSPYDRGRYEAAMEITKQDRDEEAMIAEAMERHG